MRINFKIVLNVLAAIIFFLGTFMLIPTLYSGITASPDFGGLCLSSIVCIVFGAFIWYKSRCSTTGIHKREGYLIVAFAWITIAIISATPYMLTGTIENCTDAIFESVSGLTTTGATIFTDIESISKGVLLWRSLTQWIGGMGIIVLTVALFPLLGIGGVELFVAESPGPTSNKIHPRIKETAKRLWLIYVSLTVTLSALLYLEGMKLYDAINHGLTTMATGGFSTKNASIAYYNVPIIQYTILVFMFIAGTNYTIIYFGLKGRIRKVFASDEFKAYCFLVIIAIASVVFSLMTLTEYGFEESFRYASFQVVSLITTTGFVTADYTAWHSALSFFFFCLLFTGACAGSTSGGIKVIRHYVFAKNSILEFKRLLHPNSLIRIKIDQKLVAPRILTHVLVFLLIYLMIFMVGTLALSIIIHDFQTPLVTAAGAVATALGNIGPAIGEVGPLDNFSKIPQLGKWILAAIMLLGRLELFSILILFTPYFWRSN